MKKVALILVLLSLFVAILGGCASDNKDTDKQNNSANEENKQDKDQEDNKELKKIIVGASITPHAEILETAKSLLASKGFELEIVEYNDYVQPNLALDAGDLDANYFQHQPYLDEFNADRGLDLVSVAIIHYEPFGIYPGKTKSIDDLQDGAEIAVPNDGTNEARALLLLEAQGLIKLAEGVGMKATVIDIVENPKNLEIHEIEAAQLARSLQDVDLAVINGNFAIQAGLNVSKDAIAVEDKDSIAAETYGNVIAIKKGDENRDEIKALVEALTSDEVKEYIESTYEGAVVPKF
ncbi:MAG: ABC transporter substrate-binding protein [Clostridiales bacterium]|jgi:D-methionine transport system substrate-binding protein|nr:ABC transporter substrate-binding protein [Clostridiales bacterium]